MARRKRSQTKNGAARQTTNGSPKTNRKSAVKSTSQGSPEPADLQMSDVVVAEVDAGEKVAKSKAAVGNKRPFSDFEIGSVAGQVWVAIADEGPMSLTALKKAVDAPEAHIMAGIGWLARENKLLFSNQGRTTRLTIQ